MSFRPIGSAGSGSASLPAKPASPAPSPAPAASGEQKPASASTSAPGPQIPAHLQVQSNDQQYYPGYSGSAAAYSPSTGYTAGAAAGPSYDPSGQYAAYSGYSAGAAYPQYDAYSAYAGTSTGYDYAASGFSAYGNHQTAGLAGSYGMTDEELAAQQSICESCFSPRTDLLSV